jgi:fatty acid desaturase
MINISSITISDPVFNPNKSNNFFEKSIIKIIRDERDLPFIFLCLKITFIVIPFGIYLFIPGNFRWWLASVYLTGNLSIGLAPFLLMLHNTSHRKLFKKKYNFLNYYIPWILAPFYGQSPETYFHHHVAMHHVENNVPPDISSTLRYRRDSLRSFLIYFADFFILGIMHLSAYFKQKKRAVFIKKIWTGELGFILMCAVLTFLNWRAALMVFILPFFITRFLLMAGNWAQHAFIEPTKPGNSFTNSITCINCSYNKKCFNDGYHIGHHLRPALHWTEMPNDFMRNLEQYAKQKAVVFQGIDYFYIWFLLMSKNYKKLADKFVVMDNSMHTKDEVIAFLKSRTCSTRPA